MVKTSGSNTHRGKAAVVRSMTGFGSGSAENKQLSVVVEIKSANSRYLDLSFRLPRNYTQFEGEIREILAGQVARGRVEVSAVRVAVGAKPSEVKFNAEMFESIFKVYREALTRHRLWTKEAELSSAREILSRKEVLELGEESQDLEHEQKLLKTALKKAIEAFVSMREVEGAKLTGDLLSRVLALRKSQSAIVKLVADRPGKARDRLIQAVKDLAPEVKLDETRLALEVALIVDRQDISEELVRFDSHCDQFEECLSRSGGQVGKKLDFLIQELVREVNTMGSKAQNAQIQSFVVEMKSEIERMREQIQNLE